MRSKNTTKSVLRILRNCCPFVVLSSLEAVGNDDNDSKRV